MIVTLRFLHLVLSEFYFVKRLSALRIIKKPCADSGMLFGCFSVLLYHALDVGGFGGGEK